MKRVVSTLLLSLLFFVQLVIPSQAQPVENVTLKKNCSTEKMNNLRVEERKLWQDHVSWTRDFIKSDLAGLEDKDKVLERLFKNQDAIGASIKPYYGEAAGEKLAELLRGHITIAGQIVDAAKGGKKDDVAKYSKLGDENADKIAVLLSGLNSNWSNKQLKDSLYRHLQLVTDQAVARLNKNWAADIDAYDKGEDHMLMFADIISEGIIKQFPQKFNK